VDQVEGASGVHGEPHQIAGVGGDLRLVERNVEHGK